MAGYARCSSQTLRFTKQNGFPSWKSKLRTNLRGRAKMAAKLLLFFLIRQICEGQVQQRLLAIF